MEVSVRVKCRQCGRSVVRKLSSGGDVRYCSPECARRAERRRNKENRKARWDAALAELDTIKNAINATVPCPTTGKVPYASDYHAWVLIGERYPDAPNLAPFRCEHCSAWHLGNSKSVKAKHRLRMREFRAAKRRLSETIQVSHDTRSVIDPPTAD